MGDGAAVADWDFACPDWAERLAAGKSIIPTLPLFTEKAEKAVRIFNKLRIPDIADQPSFAVAGADWFRDIVRVIFGSLDDEGVRHVPEVFCLVGKKNSKTTNGGGLMITALLENKVPRGEFLFIGPTQEIADLAFQQAAGMIDADPDGYLQKRFHVIEHRKTIRDRVTKAFVKVKTFSMKVMTGSKPIGVLIDELHIMGSIHYAARVLGQIRGALESKKNSFLLIITTQSDEPPAGVFKAELTYARAVRDGKVKNARMLPILYEFSEALQRSKDKAWADPANWPQVMPNLGKSLHLDTMIAGYAAAVEKSKEEERRWASQHLNVQIGMALSDEGWVGAPYWEDALDPDLGALDHWAALDALLDRCEIVVPGLDGGGLDDLVGLTLLGREAKETEVHYTTLEGEKRVVRTKRWLSWSHAWCQRSVLTLRKAIAPKLLDFELAGELTILKEPGGDVAALVDIVERIKLRNLLGPVAADPANIGEIVDALSAIDVTEELGLLIGVAQGGWLMSSIKTTERKLAGGTLLHCGGPLMAWCVPNLKIENTATGIRATKLHAGEAKIDPAMALFNAVSVMSRNPVAHSAKQYQMIFV
ncbi:phage terminase large subunit-like protein [Devosia sp. UYZn731]|uniref:terminase large subunit n=1 Tax=Devosia sp. UYZn731 TaxID=3156345 RepID=UPI003399344F